MKSVTYVAPFDLLHPLTFDALDERRKHHPLVEAAFPQICRSRTILHRLDHLLHVSDACHLFLRVGQFHRLSAMLISSAYLTRESHLPADIKHSSSVPADAGDFCRYELDSICRDHGSRVFLQSDARCFQSCFDYLRKLRGLVWFKGNSIHPYAIYVRIMNGDSKKAYQGDFSLYQS